MLEKIKNVLDLWKSGKLTIDTNGHSFEKQIIKDMDYFYDRFYKTYNLKEDAVIEFDVTDLYTKFPELFNLKSDKKSLIKKDNRQISLSNKEQDMKYVLSQYELINNEIHLKISNDDYRCSNEKCYLSESCLHPFTAFRLIISNNVITTTRNGENPKCGSIRLDDEAKNKENMFEIIYGVLVHNNWSRRDNIYYYTEGIDLELEFKNREYSLFFEGKEEILSKDDLVIRLKEILSEEADFRGEGE